VPALNDPAALPADSEQERAALAAIKTFRTSGNGYFVEQATRPQTIGYALLDSPVSLAAWMIDHDTDAYYKISDAFVAGRPSGNLTRDNILDNITLYWLTGTGASAARSYWEAYGPGAPGAGQTLPPDARIAVAFTTLATLPPGRSRSSSPRNYAPRSGRFAECPRPLTHGGPHECYQHAP
jgi:hypothetical protein